MRTGSRHRRGAVGAVGAAFMIAVLTGCGSETPTPSGPVASPTPTAAPTVEPTATPSPTPTVAPTPLPSMPVIGTAVFPPGWTVASITTNVGDNQGTQLRSTIGKTYAVAAVCTGEGPMTITLRASGRGIKNVEGQPAGVEAGTIPLDCPAVDPTPQTFEFTAADDWHGVLIDPIVSAPGGVSYRVLIGTHG